MSQNYRDLFFTFAGKVDCQDCCVGTIYPT